MGGKGKERKGKERKGRDEFIGQCPSLCIYKRKREKKK